MKPPSLRFKLTLLYTGLFSALLAGFFLLTYHLLEGELESAATNELLERAAGLKGYLKFENGSPQLTFDASDPEIASFIRTATRYYQTYDLSNGTLLEQSPDAEYLGLDLTPTELQSFTELPGLADVETEGGRLRFFNDRLVSGSGKMYLLRVGVSLESVEQALGHFVRLSFWLLPLGIFLAAASGSLLAGRTLAPIADITKAAHEIEVSQLHRRLPSSGTGDELDRLAATFNDSFNRLEKSVGEMKQFTASIAHELRTPLASLRGHAEFALLHSQSLDDCKNTLAGQIEEIDKLSSMISQLLTLARADAGDLKLAREPVDVSGMLGNLAETFSPVASEKDLSIELESAAGLKVTGDRGWLERAMINLIDNAIKYAPAGGRIRVGGRQGEHGKIVLEVADNGPGISKAALPHIFERFYRADESRSKDIEGVGLGLSLVKWVVNQHQGTIEVRSEPDHGSTFRIVLPED